MGIIKLDERYSFDELYQSAIMLKENYSDILQLEIIGQSLDNRELFLLRLGRGSKNIICTGGVHGRETINPVVLLKMIEKSAAAFRRGIKEEEIKRYQYGCHCYDEYAMEQISLPSHCPYNVDFAMSTYAFFMNYTINIIPLLNPDGYMIALYGFDSIRNPRYRHMAECLNQSASSWKANARGVDINRNFPSVLWRRKFASDTPGSEPETRALMQLFHQIPSIAYLDYHSRGREIFYYRNEMPISYNQRQLRIAARLQQITGYTLIRPDDEIEQGDTGGNTVHYYSENFCKPAITLETVPDEEGFPLNIAYQEKVYHEIKNTLYISFD